jgi:GDP-L-fucose synthase
MICNAYDYHHVVWETEKPNGQYRRPTNKHILNTLLPEFIFIDLETGINKTVDWFINNYPYIRT